MNGYFLKNLPDRECLEQMAKRYPEMDPDASEVYLHFLRLGADVGDQISRYLDGYNLSTGRMSILMMLNGNPDEPRTPGDIAERCGVTPATISRLIDGLIKDELVERVPDPQNRRVNPVQVTEKGQNHMAKLLPGYFSWVAEVFGELSKPEQTQFLKLLNKLQTHLNEKRSDK